MASRSVVISGTEEDAIACVLRASSGQAGSQPVLVSSTGALRLDSIRSTGGLVVDESACRPPSRGVGRLPGSLSQVADRVSDIPAISITISTIQGWPAIRHAIASAEASAAAIDGEVIVTDGSGRPAPDPAELAPATIWRTMAGASVFQLRGLGYRLSRAPIVAVTEDHCRVPQDWAKKMVDAHAAHPEAAAIGGSVENGATGTDIDWASFLVVQATIAAPIASGRASRLSGAVNVAYKRDAIGRIDDFDGLGALDVIHQREIHQSGGILLADDSIRVIHDQSLGWRGTTEIHYHAGRTFAGFLRQRMDRVAWLRCVGVLLVPYARFSRAVVVGTRKGYGPILRRAWPAVLWLYLVQAAGQIVGFATGPGDSPRRVQ